MRRCTDRQELDHIADPDNEYSGKGFEWWSMFPNLSYEVRRYPDRDGYWVHSKTLYPRNDLAGPFPTLEAAKMACEVMYG